MKKVALIIFVLGLFSWANGQDPQFTQFYANPLYLAPSFAGATEQDRISAAYRNQWPELLNGVFVTYSFSYDHFFENFNSGCGCLLMKDVAGTGELGITNAGLQYSYDIQVNQEFHLRPGIHFNYTQQGIDFSKLSWNDELANPGGGTIEQEPSDPSPMWTFPHRFWDIRESLGRICSGSPAQAQLRSLQQRCAMAHKIFAFWRLPDRKKSRLTIPSMKPYPWHFTSGTSMSIPSWTWDFTGTRLP